MYAFSNAYYLLLVSGVETHFSMHQIKKRTQSLNAYLANFNQNIEGMQQFKIKCIGYHYEQEWEFWLGFWLGGNTAHIHDFRIPLDFLGTKDLQKNKKRPKNFLRPQTRPQLQLLKFYYFLLYLDRFDLRIQPIEAI